MKNPIDQRFDEMKEALRNAVLAAEAAQQWYPGGVIHSDGDVDGAMRRVGECVLALFNAGHLITVENYRDAIQKYPEPL